ncbi:MAG: ABC transporter substrate-binding protein [Prolixibacteraceae bacterium]
MTYRIFIYLLFLSLFFSCFSGSRGKSTSGDTIGLVQNDAATGFTIQHFATYQKLTVIDPWQKSTDNLFDYYLIGKNEKIPAELAEKQIFHTPLKRVICLSTTHIGYLGALNQTGSVIGLSGSLYLTNPELKRGIADNSVREVGHEQGLNYELIMQLKPDVVFAFGVGSEINTQINKLKDLGIPVVLVGEYLEQSAMAKAEWIKFFGAFFAKEAMADSIYKDIKSRYETVKLAVAKVSIRPAVLTGLPFKDTWWMAGGQSNLAVLINDAGGNFLWKENSSKEAFPVSLEEVFLRASKADFWINCGSVNNLNELLAFDPRFSELPAVKNSRVYNNNLHSTPIGGNDYWESGVVHPDLVLRDLVRILHPELAGSGNFSYYKKVE